jgi:thiol-disulfide isomerase/thioredoxin
MTGLVALVVVLLASAAVGMVWRSRNGRVRTLEPADQTPDAAVLATLGVDPAAAPVTLVQFSTAFCAPCRATRRVIGQVTELLPAVRHVEVDAEQHLDAVRALHILRTPTVLVVDGAGAVVKRASGQPSKADIIAAVAPYLPDRAL